MSRPFSIDNETKQTLQPADAIHDLESRIVPDFSVDCVPHLFLESAELLSCISFSSGPCVLAMFYDAGWLVLTILVRWINQSLQEGWCDQCWIYIASKMLLAVSGWRVQTCPGHSLVGTRLCYVLCNARLHETPSVDWIFRPKRPFSFWRLIANSSTFVDQSQEP